MVAASVPAVPQEMRARLREITAELAAAHDELSLQRREIALLHREAQARTSLRNVLLAVPTPVLSTTSTGSITTMHPAVSALLGVRPSRQVRTQIQAFLTHERGDDLHHLMSSALAHGAASGVALLTPRNASAVEVDVVISRTTSEPEAPALHWDLTPRDPESPPPQRAEELAALQAVASLVALPADGITLHDVLVEVVALATRAIPGADCTSLVMGDPVHPTQVVADAARAQVADGAQWRAAEGPALLAFSAGVPVLTPDATADPRWPRLGARTGGGVVRGALGVPLRSGDEVLGVLTAYSSEVGGLSDAVDVERGQIFADAVVAVLAARRRTKELQDAAENLRVALTSRAAIEQAKGVVAARLGCGVDDAFAALQVLSQDRNVRVRDIAALLIAEPANQELDLLLGDALEQVPGRPVTR